MCFNHVVISRVLYWTNMALLYHHSKADNSPGPTLGIKQFPIYHTICIRPSEWGIVRIVYYWIGYNGFAHTGIHPGYPSRAMWHSTLHAPCNCTAGSEFILQLNYIALLHMALAAMRQLQNIKTVSTSSHGVMWPSQGCCMKSWDRKNGQVLAT